jgi:glycosyltransferase involved in cell wall biosynthesis
MILFDAIYINNGGGKVLLDYLISELNKTNISIFYLLDKRLKGIYPFLPKNCTKYVDSNIIIRQFFYTNEINKFNFVFCFGNVPPFSSLKIPVYVYFHQLFFLDNNPLIRHDLIFYLKKSFLKIIKFNAQKWIVQTGNVKQLMLEKWKIPEDNILVVPFYPPLINNEPNTFSKVKNSFLYVSDGNVYKNHKLLFDAFKIAFTIDSSLTLGVTISKNYPRLISEIDHLVKSGVNIFNYGLLNRTELSKIYAKSEYLIYPSLGESFGLGIIEGIEMGCKVIGASLPYMKSVCVPSLTFDPTVMSSIKDAIVSASKNRLQPSILLAENEIQNLIKIFFQFNR